MAKANFALFTTAIGPCAIAWSALGILAVQLPEAKPQQTRARIFERFADAVEDEPPAAIRRAIDGIVSLLEGQRPSLATFPLDYDGIPPFHRRVYELARRIPPGATLSYGDIATRLGKPQASRAVGQALGRNPFALIVPCHRVLSASGKLTGFSAPGGVETKRRLLQIEGALSG